MIHRKLSTPIPHALSIAASTIAATLMTATGFGVETAVAQQPPPTAQRPTTTPRPDTPAAPTAPKPAAPGQAQAGAPEMPQLIYYPSAKFFGKGNDTGAKADCFTGKNSLTTAGAQHVAAAPVDPQGESTHQFTAP